MLYDDKWIDGNGDYLSAGDMTLLNTHPKVEVTEEKLRTAWKNHVTGKAIPNYLAFKKELGL